MEDDKLDFGDLDDFDGQQDGLLDQTGSFTNNIEDLAALEKELGIDDFGGMDTQQQQQQPTLTTEPPSSTASESKKSSPKQQETTSSSEPGATSSSNNEKNNTSSTSNNRPFVARNKHQYQNKTHRYNPYQQQQQQQQQYPTMPYQGFFPMPGGGMPYGQAFINMPMQSRMNGNMMGLPMMGYNNMPSGPPQNRRIHVNPKFAGARPPLAPAQTTRKDEPDEPVHQERQRSTINNNQNAADENQTEQDQSRVDRDRKRQREYDGPSHRQTNTSQHSDQPFQRRRLDTTSSSSSSSPSTTTRSQDSSLQSSIGSKGDYEKPIYQRSTLTRRDIIDPSTTPSSNSNGISIRGAALAAATAGSTNYGRDRHSSSSSSPTRNQRPHSPPLPPQIQPSTMRIMTENTNTSITSRLNLNNSKQYASTNDKNGMKSSILQRLGGKNNNNSNNNETLLDHDRNNRTSNSNNDSLTPQFANGKSSKLIISNISAGVTESDLKALEPKDVKDVSLNRKDNKATLLFVAIDPAVNFRRKYNRTMVGDQHISVTFAKP